jgi:hypothetical protein
VSLVLALMGVLLPLVLYGFYFLLLFVDALLKNANLKVAILALFAALTQFTGYGIGFFKSTILLTFSKKEPEELFPKLFFKKK